MPDRPQFPNVAPRAVAAEPTFTMRKLRRLALWGSAAAGALFVAALAGRSDVGSQRVAGVLSSLHLASPRSPPSNQLVQDQDTDSATRQLAQTVRRLAEDRDRLMTRLAAIEHHLDDVTGSVARQIEAAKSPTPEWPNNEPPSAALPPVAATPASLALPVVSNVPPATAAFPIPPPSSTAVADAPPAADPATEYGVDIGGTVSLRNPHAHWAAVRAEHPSLFAGLRPLLTPKEVPRLKRTESRLEAGPLPSLEVAEKLCTSLAAFHLSCHPTMLTASTSH